VSVVVPVLNEVDNVEALTKRVAAVLGDEDVPWELLFIDDGSTDGSWESILEICADHPEVRAIRQRRNFGKAAALATGFAYARGRAVITMDGDLQDDPAEIPRFLAALAAGNDVVSGWKRVRHDPLSKRLPSRIFNAVTRQVSGVPLHDFNCGFKAYTRSAARSLIPHVYGEMHRYLPVLLGAQGYSVGEIEVRHHPRLHGRSKYGARRLIAGGCDVLTVTFITRFRERPLHVFASAAALVLLGGGGLTAVLSVTDGVQTSLTALLPAFAVTVSLVTAGLICELIVHGLGAAEPHGRMREAVRLNLPVPHEDEPVTDRRLHR
jgi:glycosyltransferase involved in cell wall biosynthesis